MEGEDDLLRRRTEEISRYTAKAFWLHWEYKQLIGFLFKKKRVLAFLDFEKGSLIT